jgi:hypothetical protein
MKVSGARWSDEQILDVLRRLAAGEPKSSIARAYGVTTRSIRHMLGRDNVARLAHEYSLGLHNRAQGEADTVRPAPSVTIPSPAPFWPFVDFQGMMPTRQQIASGSVPASYAGRSGSSPDAGPARPPCAESSNGQVGGGLSSPSPDPRKDPALHCPTAPNGYHLRGVSTLVNAEGQPVQTWVKTTRDPAKDRFAEFMAALETLTIPLQAAHAVVKAPQHSDADLLCVYPIGDPHFGMYSWHEETGADYDVETAERLHVNAIRQLVDGAPPAKRALIISLGDFFHCDDNLARTSRSGAPLDTDTRWAKVLRVGLRAMASMIDAALIKHESVRVIFEVGNHDPQTSQMLALAMATMYRNDPRVEVDDDPGTFHWYRFGKVLIGTTHGSDTKPAELPGIMATDRARDWGETRHRYWYVGHVHHETVKEYPGCVVEHCRTLAARDAWAHRSGYRADRDIRVDVWHREHGRVTRNILGLERVA